MRTRAILVATIALIATGCGKGLTYCSTSFCSAFKGDSATTGIAVSQSISWQSSITIEVRIRISSPGGITGHIFNSPLGSGRLALEIDGSQRILFSAPNVANCGASVQTIISSPLNLDQNYHLAATATSGGNIQLYVNGTGVGPLLLAVSSLNCVSPGWQIGNKAAFNDGFQGTIDDFRLSTSSAPRYSSNFTPPTSPLSIASDTVALLSFDTQPSVGFSIPSSSPTALFNSFSGSYVTSPF